MKYISSSWRFLLFWVLAFLSFPIAGVLAIFVVPVNTPVRALIAGAIAGAALGLVPLQLPAALTRQRYMAPPTSGMPTRFDIHADSGRKGGRSIPDVRWRSS